MPKLFLTSRSTELLAEIQKDEKKREKWREDYIAKIEDYFNDRGLKRKLFAWHKKKLLSCFEKVFSKNKFFNGKTNEDLQWGMYVTEWFVLGIVGAMEIKSGNHGYEPAEMDLYDLVHGYA